MASARELVAGRLWMANELRHLAGELERLEPLQWWLSRPLLEDSVRILGEAIQLRTIEPGSPRGPYAARAPQSRS
jgi:hypothetical protein